MLGQEGSSPSGAFAEITLDSGSSMSGEENGQMTERAVVSPGRVLGGGVRSASPAKRSATDMEDGGDKSASSAVGMPGSFASENESGRTHSEEAMYGAEAMDTQGSVTESMDTSAPGTMSMNTSATSFQSDALPPYSAQDAGATLRAYTNYTTQEIDLQQARVMQKMSNRPLDEGHKGVVLSSHWLARVLSRSSEGLKNSEYTKESREGLIGPVDNSEIVAEGGFDEPGLIDQQGQKFIPLKPGLSMSQDYEIMNDDAWGEVVGAYGIRSGQRVISRYARNTAGPDAAGANIMYEVYPPVFTIRKATQPTQEEQEEKQPTSASSLNALRQKQEMRGRGQLSPDDAIRLVSSRHEKFQKFLARSKEAAGIQRSTKVKIWKLLDPSAESGQEGAMSVDAPSSTQPKATDASRIKLLLPNEEFDKLEIGKDLELVDAKDLTNDSNYSGASTMEMHVLGESHTLILEEQIGGPGGGEFASNKKKAGPLFKLAKKDGGSKPGSAPASGRTSPAPQSGIMTRGRARRDGRTRGVVGLTNLGNTCYMNSALQCIRSVEELAIYFLSEKYKKEINMENPLGHKGVMAKQYANLLFSLYADNAAGAVTPTSFKKTIGSMQPMFSGYGQQDSQEFLSFLVDALHEDLNRIQKKPYNENPDSDDSTVHDPQAIVELGEIYRKNHRARNESVAMDLFSGFYKNTMECPVCDKISITFDPYSLLTVQLPIENTFQHTITFVPLRSRPVNHIIDMDKNSTIKTMKEYIASKHAGVQADRMWMIEVYNHKIYKVFDNSQTLAEASVQPNDYLFVYELQNIPSNSPQPEKKSYSYSYSNFHTRDDKVPDMDDPKADCFAIPVFPRQKNRSGNGFDITLHPIYITITREEAKNYEIILKKVLIAATRLTSTSILESEADTSSTEVSAADEMERDDQVVDGNTRVNDTSSSEDGYVNVSVNKPQQNGDVPAQTNGVEAADDRPVPTGFMDPQYFVSPALRNQLFTLNYAQSDNNMYCASMSSITERSIRVMSDRVKQPVRRDSTGSSSSGEESTTSTGSGAQANGESDESDDGDLDKPDLVLGDQSFGNESYLSMPTPVGEDDDDNVSTPENAFMSRKGRRRITRKGGKNRRGKNQKYGNKDKKGQQQGGFTTVNHNQRFHSKFNCEEEDNLYYIKLGEGIVIDWYPEAFDALFGGAGDDPDEMRGHFVSHSDGKGLPIFNDTDVKGKKERREARKRNGITLDDCFAETGKREVLSEDNAWYCNRCKELRRATKTLEIWTIPDILVVHLKRFGGTRSFRDKIDVLVDYPIEGLDMTEKIGLKENGKEYLYDLFAVDNHFGGLGGGHYTAMAKNFNDGQWYDYNGKRFPCIFTKRTLANTTVDSHCSKLLETRLHSAAAYLLFYRRRSDNPLGPQYLQELVVDFRNPAPTDETAEESDSGEGRLGGPNGSLLSSGSSSGLTGAGAAAAGSLGNLASGSSALGAGRSLTTRTGTEQSSGRQVEGGVVYGPVRPPHLRYGNQGTVGWGFGNLNEDQRAGDAAGSLMNNVDNENDNDDGDASSTAHMDWEDAPSSLEAGRGTPVHSSPALADDLERDDHAVYSSAHEDLGDVLHLEDAGTTGAFDYEEEETPVDVYPGLPTPMQEDSNLFSQPPE